MSELEYIIFVTKCLPFIVLVLRLRLAYGYSNTCGSQTVKNV